MVQRMLKHSRLGTCREKKLQVETKKTKQSSLVCSVVERREHSPEAWESRFHFKNYLLRSSDSCGTEEVREMKLER